MKESKTPDAGGSASAHLSLTKDQMISLTPAHDDLLFLAGSLALEETGCGVSFDHEVVVKELLEQCRQR